MKDKRKMKSSSYKKSAENIANIARELSFNEDYTNDTINDTCNIRDDGDQLADSSINDFMKGLINLRNNNLINNSEDEISNIISTNNHPRKNPEQITNYFKLLMPYVPPVIEQPVIPEAPVEPVIQIILPDGTIINQ